MIKTAIKFILLTILPVGIAFFIGTEYQTEARTEKEFQEYKRWTIDWKCVVFNVIMQTNFEQCQKETTEKFKNY